MALDREHSAKGGNLVLFVSAAAKTVTSGGLTNSVIIVASGRWTASFSANCVATFSLLLVFDFIVNLISGENTINVKKTSCNCRVEGSCQLPDVVTASPLVVPELYCLVILVNLLLATEITVIQLNAQNTRLSDSYTRNTLTGNTCF